MMVPAPVRSVTTPRREQVAQAKAAERQALAAEINSFRDQGFSQVEIADMLGISQAHVSRLVGVTPRIGAQAHQRNQLAQSVLGHSDDLTEREARVLAILRGQVSL